VALVGVSGKLARNDWVFNKKLIKSPKVIAYKIVGILRQWKKMLKVKDQRAERSVQTVHLS
jgi:hypothetical protein